MSGVDDDAHYYTFSSQLVAALILFFLAYAAASIVLAIVIRIHSSKKNTAKSQEKSRIKHKTDEGDILHLVHEREDSDHFPLEQEENDENEREFLTFSLATFVLAVGFVWLELLVLSVLASTSLNGISLNSFYVFSWCTKDLVSILWSGTVWLSSISLFVLAPFGFLYYEAEGLGGRKGFVSRVSETLLVLSGFTVTLYGSFHLLQLLLDRCGLLQPFSLSTSLSSEFTSTHLPLDEFSIWDILEGSFGLDALKDVYRMLEAHVLYSHVWHFLPGLTLLLATCHHGFIRLIAQAYSLGVHADGSVSSSSISALPSSSSTVASSLPRIEHIEVLKLELATAERKWSELELDLAREASHRSRAPSSKLSVRAIAPSNFVRISPKAALSQRQNLLVTISRLRTTLHQATSTMEQQNKKGCCARICGSTILRNTVWMVMTLIAVLLTWHIIFRVAQREARLIFRGSIFRWFRSASEFNLETLARDAVDDNFFQIVMRNVWWVLYQVKILLGSLLSLLTGKGLNHTKGIATTITSGYSHILPPLTPSLPSPPLFDSPFLSGMMDVLRILFSVLLGVNGFGSPVIAFCVDVMCIGFLLLASATVIYSSPFVQRWNPRRMYSPLPAGDPSEIGLFLPQFFTLTAVIMLLLSSSLPLATWMLGLSSFDLMEFYPHSSVQFSVGHGATVPLFVHLYNLMFLALTGWHVTQISKQIFLYVLFDQIVARIESLVERMRVALGWADKNAPPEDRFQLFGRCKRYRDSLPNRTKAQWTWHGIKKFFSFILWILSPFGRGLWFLVIRFTRVIIFIMRILWKYVHAFIRQELADDDAKEVSDELTVVDQTKSDQSIDDSLAPVSLVRESSFAAQMLAEVDAAAAQSIGDSGGIEVSEDMMIDQSGTTVTSMSPRATVDPQSTGGLQFFARSMSAPARFYEDGMEETRPSDAESVMTEQESNEINTPESDVDPLLGYVPTNYSPLYRSTTTWTGRTEKKRDRHGDSFFLTPGIVPSLSRKLSTDHHILGEHSVRTVSEEDFPQFTLGETVTSIEEEKEHGTYISHSSSTAGTPRYSPHQTPTQSDTAARFILDDILDLSAIDNDVDQITPAAMRHRLSTTLDEPIVASVTLDDSMSSDSSHDSNPSSTSVPSDASLTLSPLILPPSVTSPVLSVRSARSRDRFRRYNMEAAAQSTSSESEPEE